MSKLTVFCLVVGTMSALLTQQPVEARPFFFNIFTPTTSSNTVRTETQTTNNFPLGDLISAKLRFLTTLLQGNVSGGVGFRFNKFGVASTTTTTSKPDYTTKVNTVYVPETTIKIGTIITATEENKIDLMPLTITKKPDVAISVDIDADLATQSTTQGTAIEIAQEASDNFTTIKPDVDFNVSIDADLATQSSTQGTDIKIPKPSVDVNVNIDADLATQSSTQGTDIKIPKPSVDIDVDLANQSTAQGTDIKTPRPGVDVNVNLVANIPTQSTTQGTIIENVSVDLAVEATTADFEYETTQKNIEQFTTSKVNIYTSESTGYVYTTKKPGYEYTTRHSVTPGYVYNVPDSANDVYNPFLPPY
ncbi:uncharacterized protein LOC119666723 [Teleopsis dalmanni]|uniref:uncharacterized protein LOC119666723 n=1 Tax=Teleopsis dalmanni TaxID=139649 RepID=UPI0018CD4C04|nr:uncharacterized protein LOC119666723 [Teleopsis dalmanni]